MTRLCLITTLCLLASGTGAVGDDRVEFFERKVRPLLLEKCGDCHTGEEPEARLTLTTVAGIAAGGETGPLLVPGDPEGSRLIQAVRYTATLKMPPDERLAADEIAVIEQWVRDGAALPDGAVHLRSSENSEFRITEQDRQWWSFQPITAPAPPHVTASQHVRTPVDRFVLKRLEEAGLSLSPEADRATLIRRVTFDLTGLPPTPEEVAAFVGDARPDAYERLVDRLLASPHYGIRWGRHWLDGARYSDTNGGGFDYVYPHAWRYRDYVVNALNGDKPYDQFLIEQIAGDLLPIDCDEDEYVERLVATGLLTLAPKGLGEQDKEKMWMDVVDDQIDVLGRSVMGMTLACARCHDHKFDPISTRDYYALAGIFRSTTSMIDTDKNPSYWPESPLEYPAVTEARNDYLARRNANQQATEQARKEADEAVVEREKQRAAEYVWSAWRILVSRARAAAVAHWTFDEAKEGLVPAERGPEGRLTNYRDPGGPVPENSSGRLGQALRFSGPGAVAIWEPEELACLEFGSATDFSVAFWVRAADGYGPQTADSIIAAEYGAAMWFIALRPGTYNGIYLRHYDGSRAIDIKPAEDQLARLTDTGWHHIVFTSDRDGNGRVYIDGQQCGDVPIAEISQAAAFDQPTSFLIGASTNQFQGELDDVAIWNRSLSAGEVATLFREAGDSPDGRNVSQVEQLRPMPVEESDVWTVERAAETGLVPGIVRRCTEQLATAEASVDSPLSSLFDASPQSLADVTAWIVGEGESLQDFLADAEAGPFVISEDVSEFHDADSKQRLSELAAEAEAIERDRVPDPELGMVARDTDQPSNLRVHLAGNHRDLGEEALRGFPEVLQWTATTDVVDDPVAAPDDSGIGTEQSGRLQLAEWLTAPEHPLTARVFVNRVWMWHFGRGLVPTPDNFGTLGESPSHPQLLDWLARKLMDEDWSLKALHREIVLSAVYRQQSNVVEGHAGVEVDSGNRLLWRMNRRRLEAEAIRDAILAVSGGLDSQMRGTVNEWKPKMFSVNDDNAETANYRTRRRSIYLPVVRGAALHEMLQLFDVGDPNAITPRRDVTTVAPQALFLINSPFVGNQAAGFAERINGERDASLDERIAQAYRLALGRTPTPSELSRSIAFLTADSPERWRMFCQMLFCLNEFAYVD